MMSLRELSYLVPLLVASSAVSCSSAERSQAASGSGGLGGGGQSTEESRDPPQYSPPPLGFHRVTTQGSTALRNLDSQIDGLEQRRKRIASVDTSLRLGNLLLTRAQLTGNSTDQERALALAEELLATSEEPAIVRFAAQTMSGVHEFGQAARLYEQLNNNGLPPLLAVATGRGLKSALEQAERLADEAPSFDNHVAHAAALAALGHYQEADRAYMDALSAYRDVSPFPVAFVQFRRGVMWAEQAARPDYAVELYRDAVARVPSYAVAVVHLAELELEEGKVNDASTRLAETWNEDRPVAEVAALLGEVLQRTEPRQAADWTERAASQYTTLLHRLPYAYLDHAAEFFSGPGGDGERALELALLNLERRKTSRALMVAIEAALATSDPEQACTLAQRSAELEYLSASLHAQLGEISCGDNDG